MADSAAADLHLLTPVTVHPNYEAKEPTIKNYLFWVFETRKEGADQVKTCKSFSLSGQLEQSNSTYLHLFNLVQKRKVEAQRFLDKFATDEASSAAGHTVSSLFYATEALPTPTVVFRFSSNKMVFEVFDVVPSSFQCQSAAGGLRNDNTDRSKENCTARVLLPDHPPRAGSGSGPPARSREQREKHAQVRRVLPFSIFNDKSHLLVATYPVLNFSNFWTNSEFGFDSNSSQQKIY